MDVHAVLKALHQERELLNQAIVTLEILARGKGSGGGVRRVGCARVDGASLTARRSFNRQT